MFIGIPLNSDLYTGKYRFTFTKVVDFKKLPFIDPPVSYKIEGKTFTILKAVTDPATKKFIIDFELKENPVPVMAIAVTILIILGVGATFMVLDKVEKILDNPGANIALVVGSVVALYLVYKNLKSA